MPGIAVSRDVAAPAARTWSVATDLDGAADVLSGVSAVERIDGGEGFAVGTRWRETRRFFGREHTEELAVTAIDAGRSYTVESDGGGAHYVSTVRVEPLAAERSRIEMTFDARPGGVLARVLTATIGRLALGTTRKAMTRDLADIAAAAERGA